MLIRDIVFFVSPCLTLLYPQVYHKKKKHSVLGVKEKRISGMPGVSRSRANVKVKFDSVFLSEFI